MLKEKLRVYYSDRLPANFIYFEIDNLKEASIIIQTLTKRDLADDRITENIVGLEVWNEKDKEWESWTDGDGEDFDEDMIYLTKTKKQK